MTTEDPLIASSFSVDIQGVVNGFFSGASGFSNSSQVIEHKMTNDQGVEFVQKIPGVLEWGEISLERGITGNMDLWNWRQQVVDGDIQGARKDGSIIMYDHSLTEVARWSFTRGWPSAWMGPDVSAGGQDVGMESITIVHEGLKREL